MSDKGKIGEALVVFVVLMTFPIWYNLVNGEKGAPPTLRYPHEGGRCVEDTAYIRANHSGVGIWFSEQQGYGA